MKYSILGCGWLGLPLAKQLIRKNHQVNGSTTSIEKIDILKSQSVEPFLLVVDNNEITGDIISFLASDILIIDIPFRKQKDSFKAYTHLAQLVKNSTISKVIFISSTSVYADTNSIAYEDDSFKINPDKKLLVDLEQLFLKHDGFDTNIIRFSGLIGGSRNPGNFFKKGRIVKNGLAPINLIHLDDCIQIIEKLANSRLKNEIFNATADSHPTRKEFYSLASLLNGNKPAEFLCNEDFTYKIISNNKLKEMLKYHFIYSDLLKMLTTKKAT